MQRQVQVEVECKLCGKVRLMEVEAEGLSQWLGGKLVQDALPRLNVEERELLVSQTCGKCWEEVMRAVEDREDELPEHRGAQGLG